jgi:hypothetical protein
MFLPYLNTFLIPNPTLRGYVYIQIGLNNTSVWRQDAHSISCQRAIWARAMFVRFARTAWRGDFHPLE